MKSLSSMTIDSAAESKRKTTTSAPSSSSSPSQRRRRRSTCTDHSSRPTKKRGVSLQKPAKKSDTTDPSILEGLTMEEAFIKDINEWGTAAEQVDGDHVPSASKPHTVTPSYSDSDYTAAGGSSNLLSATATATAAEPTTKLTCEQQKLISEQKDARNKKERERYKNLTPEQKDALKIKRRERDQKQKDARKRKRQERYRNDRPELAKKKQRKQAEREQVKRIFNLPEDKRTEEDQEFVRNHPEVVVKQVELERIAKVKQAERERKQAEREQVKRIFNLPKDKRTPEEIKFLADNPLRLIDTTPAQRLKSWRQLTPELTSELLVVIRKISNENDVAFLSFETKDTTSRAVKYLLSAIHHGLVQYPDTCDPKVVQWNGVSKFCINSHIALLIALFMALRNDDDHQFSIEEWDEIHTEVMYGCQFAIDQKKRVGKGGRNSNPLTGSTIEKTDEVDTDGKLVWKRTDARLEFQNNANIRNTGLQFTGGGTGSAYIRATVIGVSKVWPEFDGAITIQAIQDVGKSLMDHLSITNHSVVGKLLEMRHWHSMKYFGHRPVGIYWHHKDGGTLSSITTGEMEAVASTGAKWIQSTFKHK